MTAAPAMTVVVPVHNVAPFIADMFESLCANAAPEIEFVVVDDGSTDATPQIIAEFADRLPALRVIRHDTPVGLADARNAGISAALGHYVTFLDGDDWLAPGYLLALLEAIDTLGCDFVRVDHVQSTGRRRVLHRAPEARRGVVLSPRSGILPARQRTMVDYPYAWAGAYRRELGDRLRFPSGLHTAEDRPWIWRLHREADSYAVVSLAGLFYRRGVTNSLTQIGGARQLHFLEAYAQVLDQVADEPDLQAKALRQFLALLAHHIRMDARFTLAQRRALRREARRLLARVPPDAVRAVLPTDARGAVLWPLLPGAVRAAS